MHGTIQTADPFTVRLGAGTYSVEWLGVARRQTVGAATVTVEHFTTRSFSSLSDVADPAVLYLKKVGG